MNSLAENRARGAWRSVLDVACVMAAFALVYRVFDVGSGSDERSRRLEYTRIGETISLEQVSWTDADRNLVLVLSTTCPACQDSAGFYRRLGYVAGSTPGQPVAKVGIRDRHNGPDVLHSHVWRWVRPVTTGLSNRCGWRRTICREARGIRSTNG